MQRKKKQVETDKGKNINGVEQKTVPVDSVSTVFHNEFGPIQETFYVENIGGVGCVVRYVHKNKTKHGEIISSGVFFIPDVSPLNGELRRSFSK